MIDEEDHLYEPAGTVRVTICLLLIASMPFALAFATAAWETWLAGGLYLFACVAMFRRPAPVTK
jgi:hypothetical protein